MKLRYVFSLVITAIAILHAAPKEKALPDSAQSKVAVADSGRVFKPRLPFSVLHKKYIKTSIITNVLYAGGFGLWQGVVLPRSENTEDDMDMVKLMPLSYLSLGMMYASLPIAVVSSHRAQKNYEYYHKTSPRNLTLPLTYASAALSIGSFGIGMWRMYSDYRDNHEIDESYSKYENVEAAIFTAGLIGFAGTNLYSLVYTIILGEKAKQRCAATAGSLTLSPIRHGDANGLMLTWSF